LRHIGIREQEKRHHDSKKVHICLDGQAGNSRYAASNP
jgi:hypothetical protein